MEQSADAQAQRNLQLLPMLVDPFFLERIAHAHQQHVGPGGVDLAETLGGRVAVEQIAVMEAGLGPAGEGPLRPWRRPGQ